MAALTKLLAGLTPQPVVNPLEYDGLEYKWKMFVFRPAREHLPGRSFHDTNSRIQCLKQNYIFWLAS